MTHSIRCSTLVLASFASGCLVTADPATYEPTQSPPMIVASGLNPDPRGILRIGGDEGAEEFGITASILSEDKGESVKVALYVDYGVLNGLSQPFSAIVQAWPDLEAGTLAEGPRPLLGLRWVDGIVGIQPGCHRLTLMATHAFDATTRCPVNLNDSSQITWHFRQCDIGECPESLVDCPPIDATCPLAP
ncbi:MAG TPA: hypothetical protein PK156_36345 [Polyangium sp.]|nr:hypothetical protein [Polyangium sp.]